MKKTISTTLVALLISAVSFSQFHIKGTVINTKKESLPWVNIQLLNSKFIGVSDGSGNFEFKNLEPGNYDLKFSFVGYTSVTKSFTITNKDSYFGFVILNEKTELVDEITISGTKLENNIPTTSSTITKKEIEEANQGQDIPYLLKNSPSMVVSSDAGAGIGYTYMRIRGVDASSINVTINGIPFNDAESQGSYFVDMPDLASSLESVQIQRGAGTSANGAGAFGASVNLFTNFRNEKAYAEVNNSFGSFNTMKNTIKVGTGIINKHFSFDGRISSVVSDGYIDRASSDLKSYFLSGQYVDGKNSLKFITFSGKEVTYQAWGGTPKNIIDTNRTYNTYTYDKEVDDYKQTHYQLFYNREISKKLLINTALHYTKGAGFYEQYIGANFNPDIFNSTYEPFGHNLLSKYGISPVYLSNDTILKSDLIRRKWLDNDYYGMIFSLIYNSNTKLKTTLGGGINKYDGDHYGEVIWARYASNSEIRQKYYDNTATKIDGNIYSKTTYQISDKLNGFLDLQVRNINYDFLGFDDQKNNAQQNVNYLFINPKAGLSYLMNSNTKFYTLFSVANKEPNRSDLTESSSISRPKHETLYDFELGFKKSDKKYALSVNGYYMGYKNQLVSTGALNDVGEYVRVNIENSYRAGIELEGGVQITKGLKWNGNITLSQNKLSDWTEYMDNWDTLGQDSINHTESTLSFSPSIIASSIFEFSPLKQFSNSKNRKDNLTISLISKYVGEQYYDNTESDDRKLDAYFVHDLRFNYSIKAKPFKEIVVFGSVYNVLNNLYSANAWAYRYSSGGEFQQSEGLYPQATRNFMIGLNIKF